MNFKRTILLVICVLLVFTVAVLPTAHTFAATGDYDYSRAGSYFNTSFTSSDVLELIGYEVSEGERAYLDTYGSLNVRYEVVTNQQISVVTTDGTTRVTAHTYTYIGANGSSVTWTPTKAMIDGYEAELILTDGVHIATFDGLATDDDSVVSVDYEMTTVRIGAADVNAVINTAYRDAVALKTEITSYVDNIDEINEYFTLLNTYNKYLSDKLVFEEKKTAYNNYLSDVRIYRDELTRYEAYLDELEEYNRIKDNNDNYSANYAKYEIELAKYNKYLSDLALADQQIQMLHDGLMNSVTYLNRQIYGCIFADLVDEVVGRKDELTKIGASKEDIDACAVATANIRAILKPEGGVHYTNLKTQEEKYAFYVNNYESLRDSFTLLAQSLYGVYSKEGVRITMHAASNILGREDYTERLSIFIAQLICLSNAMSVEPIMSSDGKKVLDNNITFDYRDASGVDRTNVKIIDLLEGEVFVEDIANPIPVTPVEVAEPTPPVLLELPEAPKEITRPTEPTVVADPGDAPTPVAKPDKPAVAPDTPDRLEIIHNEIYALLIRELDLGLLDGDRAELTEDVYFTPTVTLTKSLASADMIEVTFLNIDGTVITTIGTEKGTAVNFTDTLPVKDEDISATYVFDSWVIADGTAFDLFAVTEDVTLYPSFRPIYKEYGTVEKGSSYLNVDLGQESLTLAPMTHFIELAKASHLGILITADNVTLTIPYSTVIELEAAGVARFDVFVDTSSISSYSFSVFAYNAESKLVPRVSGITVSIPCADEAFAKNSILTYIDGEDDFVEVSKSYASGTITFNAITRTVYSFDLKYSISANSNLSDKITAPSIPSTAVPGQTVTLVMDIPAGVKVESLYYTLLSDNSRHVIDGNSFVMPYGNIRLGATFKELEYTVKFVSDGKVISEKGGYKYGDTVRVPNDPIKLSDDKYSYTFIGWSPVITEVTGDVTYIAEFESVPLPKVEKKVSLFNVVFYSALTVFILAILFIVLLILNKTGVINVRGVLNFAKQKFTRVGDKPSESNKDTDAFDE
jgi:hypothetical protein